MPGGLRCVRVRESADRRMQIPGWRGRTQGARLCLGDLEEFVLATEREGETRGVKMEICDCRSEIFRL